MENTKQPIELYENTPKHTESIFFRVGEKISAPTYRMHWHENIEIQYIMEGVNIARCGNDIVEADENSFYIINSTELHQSIGGKRRHALIQFSPSLFGKGKTIFKNLVRDSHLQEIMEKMIAEYYKNDEFSKFNIQGYAYLLITHLYRNYAYKTIDEHSHNKYSEKQAKLNECIKYMHKHYNKEISLECMADIANVSKYHFCNIFKEFTGQTFKEYQNRMRISKATELLATTDMSVTEIAFLCGFNDSNYFTRKFRQIIGKSPIDARKELKENGLTGI